MEYYIAIKKKFTGKWMDLEKIMSEIMRPENMICIHLYVEVTI